MYYNNTFINTSFIYDPPPHVTYTFEQSHIHMSIRSAMIVRSNFDFVERLVINNYTQE